MEKITEKKLNRLAKKIARCHNEQEKEILLQYAEDLKNFPLKEAKRRHSLNISKMRRKKILSGNLYSVAVMVCLPVVIYGMFNSAYSLIDAVICSSISASSVSVVSALSQVKNALAAFGAGIAGGGAIIVARKYGAGEIEEARRFASVLFSIILVVSLLIILILIPLSGTIIKLASISEVSKDTVFYFRLQLIELAIVAVNTMFIGLEKAKGNAKFILGFNVVILLFKLSLTCLFVYQFKVKSIVYIEVATIISQLTLFGFAIGVMFSKKNIIRMKLKYFTLRWKYVWPVLAISIPIFFGKFIMSIGKVVVNSLCGSFYNVATGGLIVGALSVSNNLSGLVTTPTNAFEEGGSTIVSQNLGNRNMKRAIRSFWVNLSIAMTISAVGFIIVRVLFLDQIVNLFNYKGDASQLSPEEIEKSKQLVQYIKEIFKYDCISILALGVTSSVLGLLYGFGQTYLSGILNFSRIGTRIITLLICRYGFDMDYRAAGVSMGISNLVILFISVGFLIFFLARIKKKGYHGMKVSDPEPEYIELVDVV